MKTVKVIVGTSVIIGGIYLIYKAVKKTNSVIDGVSEVKNKTGIRKITQNKLDQYYE